MSKVVKGVAPGLILVPAREYEWELVRRIEISIPNKGKISDLLGNNPLPEGVVLHGADDFCVFDDNLLLLWEIVRVLFAQSAYPELKDDECVNVVAIEERDGEIVISGEVLRYV